MFTALLELCPCSCSDISRQAYLKKREEAKLEELKEALEDEKYLFQVGGWGWWAFIAWVDVGGGPGWRS